MSAKKYTIITENINRPIIERILYDSSITGYSLYEHDGYYESKPERGLDIVIIDEGPDYSELLMEQICETIGVLNEQDSVYLDIQYIKLIKIEKVGVGCMI
jgi:hypothetical protein